MNTVFLHTPHLFIYQYYITPVVWFFIFEKSPLFLKAICIKEDFPQKYNYIIILVVIATLRTRRRDDISYLNSKSWFFRYVNMASEKSFLLFKSFGKEAGLGNRQVNRFLSDTTFYTVYMQPESLL
jgi:hypothetical protein